MEKEDVISKCCRLSKEQGRALEIGKKTGNWQPMELATAKLKAAMKEWYERDEHSQRQSEMVQAGGSVLETEPDQLLRSETSGLHQPLPISGSQQEAGTYRDA
jgi:hypothetical protein